ncbi:MAG TPA: helix-hairpin-helix domain-containing protein [Caulobacteraceae bacterium]|nr:helix-hairpin-helix domain-containing protein [Caulobacteraceae bacterium]
MLQTSVVPPAPYDLAQAENATLAAKLRDYAALLDDQSDGPFRARAYRKAAAVIERLPRPVSAVLAAEGREGLDALPGIGPRIAAALAELVATGRWSQLDRVRGEAQPEALFRTIPGIGPELARRLAEDLHLSSLEALEVAAHDGTLASAAGWGPRRLRMLQAALAERLGRPRLRWARAMAARPPAVMLLDVDREYRRRAAARELRRIAPKRFNPAGKAWLPILHTERGAWRFTALYSNTPLAHQLGRTGDWVVIYYETDAQPEGQCTVVTETLGPLKGERVVRGREQEISGPLSALEPDQGGAARRS